jgi:hypothetical protein
LKRGLAAIWCRPLIHECRCKLRCNAIVRKPMLEAQEILIGRFRIRAVGEILLTLYARLFMNATDPAVLFFNAPFVSVRHLKLVCVASCIATPICALERIGLRRAEEGTEKQGAEHNYGHCFAASVDLPFEIKAFPNCRESGSD